MITLSIKKKHSFVWILEREGFIQGRIVDLTVKYGEKGLMDVSYRIKEYHDNTPFCGHDKPAHLVFDTLDGAVEYYKKQVKQ